MPQQEPRPSSGSSVFGAGENRGWFAGLLPTPVRLGALY